MALRHALSIIALILSSLASPVSAAEVMVMAMADKWGSLILLEDIRTLPPMGPPYTLPIRTREYLLTGNVVSFTISVRLRWNPEAKIYHYACSPNPRDQAVIMIGAGDMDMSFGMEMGMQGRFVGHMGACRLVSRKTQR